MQPTPSLIKLRLCFFNKRKVSSLHHHTNRESELWCCAKEAQYGKLHCDQAGSVAALPCSNISFLQQELRETS